jgi:hypothetical protein
MEVGAGLPHGDWVGGRWLGGWEIGMWVKVKVTFRPTVSQSVRLGVKPILGLLTRNLSSSEVYF